MSSGHDQRTIEVKSCKPFRSEDVNYCFTAIVYNDGRKAEAWDEFGIWAPDIFKEKIDKFLRVFFCGCAPMHALSCLSNMMQIYV